MKVITSILLFLAIILMACEDEEVNVNCGTDPIYLKENSAIISDPFQVSSATINDTCLEIEVTAGGCDGESWRGQLFVFPDVAESQPPQVTVELSLEDKELCEAAIRKTFSFDMSDLYEISQSVIIRLRGWDGYLLLENQKIDIDNLSGKWNLININGGLTGINEVFSKGDITWQFDESKVNIQNSLESPISGTFETGEYDYAVVLSAMYNSYELEIDAANLGPITQLTTDSLILDLRPVDGLQYILVR